MSADKFALYEVCPACGGTSLDHLGGCGTCHSENVVKTAAHIAALEVSKATGVSVIEALEMMRRVGEVEDAPRLGYGNTIKRDGAAFATVSSWADALAVAQSMSRAYKRALFTAEGARGQRMAYRGGVRQK